MTASDVRTPTDRSGRGLTLQVSADYVLSHLGYFTVMPVLPILLAVQLADHGAQWVGIALFALAAAVRGGSLVVTRVIHRSPVRTTVVAGLLLAGGGFAASGWVAHPVAVIAALAVAGLGISVNALAMRAYIAVSTDDVARRNEMYSAIQVAVNVSAAFGPVLANVLLSAGRGRVLLIVTACYLAAAVAMALLVPGSARLDGDAAPPTPVLRLGRLLWSRRFRAISVPVIGGSLLYAQFFSAFALLVNLASEDTLVRAGCFTLNAVLVVALQVPVSRWISRRLVNGDPPARWLVVGVALFGLSFVVAAVGGTTVATAYVAITVLSVAETVFTPLVSTAFVEAGRGRQAVEILNLRQIAATIGESTGALIGGSFFLAAVDAGRTSLFWGALVVVAVLTVVAGTALGRKSEEAGRVG